MFSSHVQVPESTLPNTTEYPGLEYPPVFEPGTYSLSDVSTLLRSHHKIRTAENVTDTDRALLPRPSESHLIDENVINTSSNQRGYEDRNRDSENNNHINRNENNEPVSDSFFYYNPRKPR